MKRDAKADLEMCEKATPGPYRSWPQTGGDHALVERVFHDEQDRRCHQFLAVCGSVGVDNSVNAVFFAESREALPYWIKRAQEAEEMLKKCVKPLYNWCNNGCAAPVGHCSDCDYNKIILGQIIT